MGIYVIRIPDIGEGIAEVELVTWHVAIGDTVSEDQLVADVMTDKATVEIPCHVNGKVISLGGAVGDTLAVGAELMRIEVEGEGNIKEDDVAAPATVAAATAKTEAAAPVAAPAPQPTTPPEAGTGTYVIRIPDIGEGIAEVELVAWHVAAGDTVSEDQLVADVMTDKATVEIPCHVNGKVIALGGAVGDTLAVGAELMRIAVEGEGNITEESAAVPATVAAAPAKAEAPAPQPAAAEAALPSSPTSATESERPPVQRVVPRRANERPLASPAVRRRALDLGLELRLVHGSGPAGRIMHEDLDDFVARGGQMVPGGGGGGGYSKREGEQTVPVIGLRRMIARKMQQSKRQIPHFAYVEEVDVTEVEKLRKTLNARHASTRGKLTMLPFLARALVLALREFPQINARYDDEADIVTRYAPVHLGIAAQTSNGLMVPVVKHAEALDLWACAQAIAGVADAARSGKASRDTLTGSTITLTSLGPLGGIVSTPVINYPEVAIVGVNRMVERPMLQNGQIVPRLLMNLSSSFDHRVVDGMDAAKFIQSIRARLETPALLFVE